MMRAPLNNLLLPLRTLLPLTLIVAVVLFQTELTSRVLPEIIPQDVDMPAKFETHSPIPLESLTMGHIKAMNCSAPLVPVYDHLVQNDPDEDNYKIPRIIHITMKSRCLPPDLSKTVDKWKAALPKHSIFFHDDDSIDRLMYEDGWPEFPHLAKIMQCVKFKGAMKVDVWRILILYRYGGIYTDIDNWPQESFDESTILPNSTAFFFNDAWNRPSQWFMAMEPRHPIAYYCMMEILNRVLYLDNIAKPRVVFVTGPDALKHAFTRFLGRERTFEEKFDGGTMTGKFSKQIQMISKTSAPNYIIGDLGGTFGEIVAWNSTLNITRRERAERQHGVIHWTKAVSRSRVQGGPCMDYLYSLERENATLD